MWCLVYYSLRGNAAGAPNEHDSKPIQNFVPMDALSQHFRGLHVCEILCKTTSLSQAFTKILNGLLFLLTCWVFRVRSLLGHSSHQTLKLMLPSFCWNTQKLHQTWSSHFLTAAQESCPLKSSVVGGVGAASCRHLQSWGLRHHLATFPPTNQAKSLAVKAAASATN